MPFTNIYGCKNKNYCNLVHLRSLKHYPLLWFRGPYRVKIKYLSGEDEGLGGPPQEMLNYTPANCTECVKFVTVMEELKVFTGLSQPCQVLTFTQLFGQKHFCHVQGKHSLIYPT